jgi:capsid protein
MSKIADLWNNIFGGKTVLWSEITPSRRAPLPPKPQPPVPQAYENVWTVSYTGEKNMGEMGPIKDYLPDYEKLRLRSWQMYLESDIAQTILNKYSKWVIGAGLKLRAEPAKMVLGSEKIKINSESFNEVVEARFAVYANSQLADYSNMRTLHSIAKRAQRNAIIGGDVLVILRYVDGFVKVQLVDGAHLVNPIFSSTWPSIARTNGNEIKHGIELSPTGEHIAYYVKKGINQVERIPAKGEESGLTMAFLIYGLEYRLDSVRGLPLISAVLESIKDLERYKSATIGSAEERQKIAYSIEHQQFSTGENPILGNMMRAYNPDSVSDDIPVDVQGKQVADRVVATTGKQAFNMPIGAQLKALESRNELSFRDFYTINSDHVCAAIGIPPEVAYSKYDSNYSASRAAIKDWEHTLVVDRDSFSEFYKKIYAFWLEVQILEMKVEAPGYFKAKLENNLMVLEAYKTSRWIGANVPHIDPVKEVEAARRKLGIAADNIPLTTVEEATEELGGGDSDQNLLQFSEELKEAKRLKVIQDPVTVAPPSPAKGQ